jgi:hypothetical protein
MPIAHLIWWQWLLIAVAVALVIFTIIYMSFRYGSDNKCNWTSPSKNIEDNFACSRDCDCVNKRCVQGICASANTILCNTNDDCKEGVCFQGFCIIYGVGESCSAGKECVTGQCGLINDAKVCCADKTIVCAEDDKTYCNNVAENGDCVCDLQCADALNCVQGTCQEENGPSKDTRIILFDGTTSDEGKTSPSMVYANNLNSETVQVVQGYNTNTSSADFETLTKFQHKFTDPGYVIVGNEMAAQPVLFQNNFFVNPCTTGSPSGPQKKVCAMANVSIAFPNVRKTAIVLMDDQQDNIDAVTAAGYSAVHITNTGPFVTIANIDEAMAK